MCMAQRHGSGWGRPEARGQAEGARRRRRSSAAVCGLQRQPRAFATGRGCELRFVPMPPSRPELSPVSGTPGVDRTSRGGQAPSRARTRRSFRLPSRQPGLLGSSPLHAPRASRPEGRARAPVPRSRRVRAGRAGPEPQGRCLRCVLRGAAAQSSGTPGTPVTRRAAGRSDTWDSCHTQSRWEVRSSDCDRVGGRARPPEEAALLCQAGSRQ